MKKTYSFEDGKYQIDRDTDTLEITDVRCNKVHWEIGYEDFQFSKCIHAMLNYIDELESKL